MVYKIIIVIFYYCVDVGVVLKSLSFITCPINPWTTSIVAFELGKKITLLLCMYNGPQFPETC